ncbi:MAG: nitrilase-related carbon-nitrogen hydrolase [Bacteroidota bacterium]
MKITAAIAQVDSRVGDLKHNIEHHVEFIDRARRKGADLVMFPELSLTGYSLKDLAWELSVDPKTEPLFKPLRERSKKISIAAGFVESGANHGIYNSAVFFEDGEVKHIHRKTYLPSYGMFEEGRYFSAGKAIRAFTSRLGRIGMLVCEDAWHVSVPYLLALDGAEALLCLTASPTRVAGENPKIGVEVVNQEHHRTYARLLNTYFLFGNRVGFEDGVSFWGGSAIVSPGGAMIAQAKLNKEDLIFGQVDSLEVERARRFSRHFLDERPELVIRTLRRLLNTDQSA